MKKLIFCFLFLFFSFWVNSVNALTLSGSTLTESSSLAWGQSFVSYISPNWSYLLTTSNVASAYNWAINQYLLPTPYSFTWASFLYALSYWNNNQVKSANFYNNWNLLLTLVHNISTNIATIRTYSCSTAYILASCSLSESSTSTEINPNQHSSIIFNSTWDKMYLDWQGALYEYTLSSPYILSSRTRVNVLWAPAWSFGWLYISADWTYIITSWISSPYAMRKYSMPTPYSFTWMTLDADKLNIDVALFTSINFTPDLKYFYVSLINSTVIRKYTTASIWLTWQIWIWSPTPTPSWVIYRLYTVVLNGISLWNSNSVLRFGVSWSWLTEQITNETFGFGFDYSQKVEFPYHPSTRYNPYKIIPYIQAFTWSVCLTEPWCSVTWADFSYNISIAEIKGADSWSWSYINNNNLSWYDPSVFDWDKDWDWQVSIWEFFSWIGAVISYLFQKIIDFFVNIYNLVQQLGTIFSSEVKTFSLIPETYAIDEHSLPNSFKFTWMQTWFDATWMWKLVVFLKAFLAFICFWIWLWAFVYLNKK